MFLYRKHHLLNGIFIKYFIPFLSTPSHLIPLLLVTFNFLLFSISTSKNHTQKNRHIVNTDRFFLLTNEHLLILHNLGQFSSILINHTRDSQHSFQSLSINYHYFFSFIWTPISHIIVILLIFFQLLISFLMSHEGVTLGAHQQAKAKRSRVGVPQTVFHGHLKGHQSPPTCRVERWATVKRRCQ